MGLCKTAFTGPTSGPPLYVRPSPRSRLRRCAGTEGFQDFCLSFNRRADVRALIGERAEFVAYVNCVMDRTTLDATLDVKPGERWVQARPGHLYPLCPG